jgi:EF hand
VSSLGLCFYLTGFAAAQQIQFDCDANDDGSVDAAESRLCTDREFDEIAPGETALTEEQLFAKMMTGKEGVAPTFAEIDQNGDGQVSRAEWSDFSAERFAEATKAGGGMMPEPDYDMWREQGPYVRPAQ